MNLRKLITLLLTISICTMCSPTLHAFASESSEDVPEKQSTSNLESEDNLDKADNESIDNKDDVYPEKDKEITQEDNQANTQAANEEMNDNTMSEPAESETLDESEALDESEELDELDDEEKKDVDESEIKSSLVIEIRHYKETVITIDDYQFTLEGSGEYMDYDETQISTSEKLYYSDFVSAATDQEDSHSFYRNSIDYSLFKNLNGIEDVYSALRERDAIPADAHLIIYEKDGAVESYSITNQTI